jgi:hypothetical protein
MMSEPKVQRWLKKGCDEIVRYEVYYKGKLLHIFMTDGDESEVRRILNRNNGEPFDTLKLV